MKTQLEDNTKLFEFMYEKVLNVGGDGHLTLAVKCQDIKKVADEFYKFLGTKNDLAAWPWHRTGRNDNEITFYHDQEGFTITNQLPTAEDLKFGEYFVVIY
jgi:hypothetical protein